MCVYSPNIYILFLKTHWLIKYHFQHGFPCSIYEISGKAGYKYEVFFKVTFALIPRFDIAECGVDSSIGDNVASAPSNINVAHYIHNNSVGLNISWTLPTGGIELIYSFFEEKSWIFSSFFFDISVVFQEEF